MLKKTHGRDGREREGDCSGYVPRLDLGPESPTKSFNCGAATRVASAAPRAYCKFQPQGKHALRRLPSFVKSYVVLFACDVEFDLITLLESEKDASRTARDVNTFRKRTRAPRDVSHTGVRLHASHN